MIFTVSFYLSEPGNMRLSALRRNFHFYLHPDVFRVARFHGVVSDYPGVKTEGGGGGGGQGGAVTNHQAHRISSSDTSPHNGVLRQTVDHPSLPAPHQHPSQNEELHGNQMSTSQATGTTATSTTGISE
uniref:Uncharacterized protein n=1 Tax=Nothobranchius furzeri TaxID=105023 RepID=A0A1A7ZEU6_NOTFU